MKEKLTFEAFYPHAPGRVWDALTSQEALKGWLLTTDFQPQIGFRFRMNDAQTGPRSIIQGEVLALEEGKSLRYTWDDGEAGSPSVVTWTLSPKDGGTHLRLEHEAIEVVASYVLIPARANWSHALYSSLPTLLFLREMGRPPVPIVYVKDDGPENQEPEKRAGFRQEEILCL